MYSCIIGILLLLLLFYNVSTNRMFKMSDKKKRSPNFTTKEENALLSAVKKYPIIESKKTDAVNVVTKKKAWKSVEELFNSGGECAFRSADVLKKKYENIKKQIKKKKAEERSRLYVTGGGPHVPPEEETQNEREMMELWGAQISGGESHYDTDALSNKEEEFNEDSETEFSILTDDNIPIITIENSLNEHEDLSTCNTDKQPVKIPRRRCLSESSSSSSNSKRSVHFELDAQSSSSSKSGTNFEGVDKNKENWATYNPKQLKERTSSPLLLNSRVRTCDKISQWVLGKNEIVGLQHQNLLLEYEQKRKRDDELHEITKRHMEERQQKILEQMDEEHQVKMKILEKNFK